MCLFGVAGSERGAAECILPSRYRLQMRWVAARRIATQMVEIKAVLYRAIEILERRSVNKSNSTLFAYPSPTIPSPVFGAHEHPAVVRVIAKINPREDALVRGV